MIAFIKDICLKKEQWKKLRHVPGGNLGGKMSLSNVIVGIDVRKPIKLLVTALPPGGDKSYNACLFIVDRYTEIPIFLPCHEDDTAMDTALLIWKRVISHTGLFENIISDRDQKFKSTLWTDLHKCLGTKLSFSTAYHPQTDGLAERMIQTLEDMIRIFCAYGLDLEDSDGFTHDWCTLIPELELAYRTYIRSSTGNTPAMLEK
ncbi:hypothetical protein O181_051135 [Austropuccinia psidii MF-1]|uniref:Integrase catalytic domain-containing protein n=1 Tax=Austropuccinia psidii MF-1 TaxID=1389203 RepID=A0A9Q3HRI7_9BASI|nr:hypothetical protein [Austropuccinia psidii MF-1]